ncbi:hypothetical protein BDZ88DRAFT_276987 [Geranomyces variabilis]|nr:hypothetical protein BDZ88DRAFT_276987 [Geranomyces variabilis]KAJ3138568.1 hypothetical protein HDU90_001010 [Geranomyces variabilis]
MDANIHSKLHVALQNALDAVGLLDFAQSLRVANTIEESAFRKVIHRLTACEQMYESVGFIRQRFFRKENLALSFQALHADVQDLHARIHSTDPAAEAVIAICAALKLYCVVREQLVHIHQFLASAERHDEASYQRLLEDATQLEATFKPETGGRLLDPLLSLGTIVVLEVSCLKNMLSAETACERYNLKDAALQLFLANDCVSRLSKLLASGGGQNGGTYSRSEMHLFYSRLIASISDKTGVFFHHVLARHISDHDDEPPGGLENLTAPAKILSQYQTQTKARSISLIYLIRPETPFSVDGYACSNGASNNPLTGLQSFPAICHIPTDRPPTEHWPNVVSLLQHELMTQIPIDSEGQADAEISSAHNPAEQSLTSRPSKSATGSSGGGGGGGGGAVGLSSLFASYLRLPLRQRIAAAGGSASPPSRPASPSLGSPAAASRRPRGPTACFYDSKVNVTYVLALVVPRIVVCVIHAGRFDDKRNGQASAAFVARLARCLEHSDVLAGLKSKA